MREGSSFVLCVVSSWVSLLPFVCIFWLLWAIGWYVSLIVLVCSWSLFQSMYSVCSAGSHFGLMHLIFVLFFFCVLVCLTCVVLDISSLS